MTENDAYFFSYSRKDATFVLSLATELRAAGADLWLDQLDIRGGQKWDDTVEEALKRCRGVLVVLTPEAVASSNVMDEVAYALEKGKFIIPIVHKQCEIPFRLRRLQYVDFTSDRGKAVAELLRALRIENHTPARGTGGADHVLEAEEPTESDSAVPGSLAPRFGTPRTVEDGGERATIAKEPRFLHACAGFVAFGTLATVATILTSLLPTETRDLQGLWRREPMVFLFTFVFAGTPGAICGLVCGRQWRLIRTALVATFVAWAIGLWWDPRYEGTQFGFVAGPIIGSIVATLQKKQSARPAAQG